MNDNHFTSKGMTGISPHKQFLIDCLNLSLADADVSGPLPAMTEKHWPGLEVQAEYHSVAPLVYRQIQRHHIAIPKQQLLQLKALVIRHRRANTIRFSCLQETADLFGSKNIELIALKGAALAHILYDNPFLRPMNDMDLLVAPDQAKAAADLLLHLGYSMPHGAHRFNHRPHHLPMLQKKVQGMTVTVEIHTDLRHRDSTSSMTIHDLIEQPQIFQCGELRIKAMGHIDMLRHLCRHSFSASTQLRLIHLYDVMAYAIKFHDRIDWQRLGQQFPYVINGIRCIHFILPCPGPLTDIVRPPVCRPPGHCGESMRPLSKIVRKGRPWSTLFKELFLPSPWWKHAYYGIPPEDSLGRCHWLTHPLMVGRWLSLRAFSAGYSLFHSPAPKNQPPGANDDEHKTSRQSKTT